VTPSQDQLALPLLAILEQAGAGTKYLLVKSDDGSLRCEAHQRSAAECLPARTDDFVWTDKLDRGRYVATVTRTALIGANSFWLVAKP